MPPERRASSPATRSSTPCCRRSGRTTAFRHARARRRSIRRGASMLVTTHRRESFGAPLRAICAAVRELACRFPDLEFVLPVHPNPRSRSPVEPLLGDLPGMLLIEPVDYLEFVHLMNRATWCSPTAAGSRRRRRRSASRCSCCGRSPSGPEGVAAGTAVVGGHRSRADRRGASELLHIRAAYRADGAPPVNPYGDGHASERIARRAGGGVSDEAARHRRHRLHRLPSGGGRQAARRGGGRCSA